jgi:hypothetical protein
MLLIPMPLICYLLMLPILVIMSSLGYGLNLINPMYIWFLCMSVYTTLYTYLKRKEIVKFFINKS